MIDYLLHFYYVTWQLLLTALFLWTNLFILLFFIALFIFGLLFMMGVFSDYDPTETLEKIPWWGRILIGFAIWFINLTLVGIWTYLLPSWEQMDEWFPVLKV